MIRPPRTPAHAVLQTYLGQFRDAGLIPVVSTNGGIPTADIEVTKGAKPGDVTAAVITETGTQRLAKAAQDEFHSHV